MATLNELYDEGIALKDEGNLEEAAAKLEEALVIDANYALAHSGLSVILQKLDKHSEAVEHAKKVCELEPNDPFSYTAMSVTCQRAFAGTGDHTYIHMAEEAMAKSHTVGGR